MTEFDQPENDTTIEIEASMARVLQSLGEGQRLDRRGFMRGFALAGALAGLTLGGCVATEQQADPLPQLVVPTPKPRLRAAFSHNGLKGSWNARGRDTSQFLGRLLGIDVVNYSFENGNG